MGKNERRTYPNAIAKRYRKAGNIEKSKILEVCCVLCDFNRKYAMRTLQPCRRRAAKRAGRKAPALLDALKRSGCHGSDGRQTLGGTLRTALWR